MNKLKLALPNGHLGQSSYDLFRRAYYKISGQDRTYSPYFGDPSVTLKIVRPQEIPLYVADGIEDLGVTGIDWIKETGADVEEILDLEFGGVKIVAAIPKSAPYGSVDEMMEAFWKEGKNFRVAAEYLNITADYISSLPSYKKRFGKKAPLIITPWWRKGENEKAAVYLSFGATEAKPPEIVDMIVDVTETGTTLEQNNLKQVGTIMTSTAHLVANKKALEDPWKREKIQDFKIMLGGAVDAQKKLHIFVNVREENLPKLLSQLKALKRPTVSPLSEEGWFAVNTVIDKGEIHSMLPVLKKYAQGLVIHEPQQLISLDSLGGEKKGKR